MSQLLFVLSSTVSSLALLASTAAAAPCAADADCHQDSLACYGATDVACGSHDPADCTPPGVQKTCRPRMIECVYDSTCPENFTCDSVRVLACDNPPCSSGACGDLMCFGEHKDLCTPRDISCTSDAACPTDWACRTVATADETCLETSAMPGEECFSSQQRCLPNGWTGNEKIELAINMFQDDTSNEDYDIEGVTGTGPSNFGCAMKNTSSMRTRNSNVTGLAGLAVGLAGLLRARRRR